jgi:hypothetical protein
MPASRPAFIDRRAEIFVGDSRASPGAGRVQVANGHVQQVIEPCAIAAPSRVRRVASTDASRWNLHAAAAGTPLAHQRTRGSPRL